MLKGQKYDKKNIKPIIFQNKPIEEENKDLFDFSYQKRVLNTAIESNARIIGIVGDYGTGKSSITKLLEKDRRSKKDKIININLWGQFSNQQYDDKKTTSESLIKSFLYQLAFANDKRNASFAKYINARLSKNNGKLGIAYSTKKVFIWIAISALFFIIFLTCNSSSLNIQELTKNIPCLQNCIPIVLCLKYLFGAIGIAFLIVATIIATPVFSTWKSEGNRNPDDSDIYEIYFQIVHRISSQKKRKCIIFIDDLDRTSEKKAVVSFLKEIYKCVHLLPDDMQTQMIFIISLKAESLLDIEEKDVYNPDLVNIYSKIFDYTLNIKQIHNENYREVVSELLEQEKDPICLLENKIQNHKKSEKEILANTLSDLKWIYSDENVTIRELKERLNESFLLYQTLLERNYENPSIELKKCAAVTFLKRKFEKDYNEILLNEKSFAQLIRDCNKSDDKDEMSNIITKSTIFKDTTSNQIKTTIKEMIISRVIEDDFSMYLYSYPKHSYIKNSVEKELFDVLIHNDSSYLANKSADDNIKYIINEKSGKIIDDAINKYLQSSVPDIIYENESLFKYVIEKFKQQQSTIFNRLQTEIENFIREFTLSINHVVNAVKFTFDEQIKNKLINILNNTAIATLKKLTKENLESCREKLLSKFKEFSIYLLPAFTDDSLPLFSKEFFDNISDIKIKEYIIKTLSDKRLQEFDQIGFNVLDCNSKDYLLSKKSIISLLYSYAINNQLNDFDFSQEWICSELVRRAPRLLELTSAEDFIKIRKTAKSSIAHYSDDFYTLYNDDFPVITESELDDLEVNEIYTFVDQQQITIDNCCILSSYCNEKQLQADNLFSFIKSLFLNKCRISKPEIIKKIVTSIDFNIVKFNSLSSEQQEQVISPLTDVFELNTVAGAFEFMRVVNYLIENFEIKFFDIIRNDDNLFVEYLNLLNTLKSASKTTLEIIKDKTIKTALEPEITDYLYKNRYYIRYIIGKTLFDNYLTYNDAIPLEKYYTVFKTSDSCFEHFANNDEIINMFYNQKLYFDAETPTNRYIVFYKKRQPLDLIKIILSKLNNNEAEQKKYLGQITDIDTENEALDFIELITSSKYIELLKDANIFYYLWHKMWNRNQKQKFTKTVNQLLGTTYNAGDAKNV